MFIYSENILGILGRRTMEERSSRAERTVSEILTNGTVPNSVSFFISFLNDSNSLMYIVCLSLVSSAFKTLPANRSITASNLIA